VSRLSDSRAAIVDALEAGGVAAATTGQLSAPCVLLEAGDPWSTPQRMPGRVGRWRLTAIAGRTDSDASLEELAELVDAIDVALGPLAGVELPTWARPVDYKLGGVTYAATVATVQYATS